MYTCTCIRNVDQIYPTKVHNALFGMGHFFTCAQHFTSNVHVQIYMCIIQHNYTCMYIRLLVCTCMCATYKAFHYTCIESFYHYQPHASVHVPQNF